LGVFALLVNLAEGAEAGALHAGHGGGLAVVDFAVAEGLGDEVEVVEDGGLVLDPDEGDKGRESLTRAVGAALLLLEAEVVLEAKAAGFPAGHGAASAIDFDVTAAGDRSRFHGTSLFVTRCELSVGSDQ
jgi:hypothetical protein